MHLSLSQNIATGNEISTIGGAIATAGTAFTADVTFGQVKELNDAVEGCARFTAKKAEQTIVRHVAETAGTAVATAAVSVAAGVTLGQIDALNKTVVKCAEATAKSGSTTAGLALEVAESTLESIPVVAHVKGCISYAAGCREADDRAMRSGMRAAGVMAGGVAGFFAGGPVGAIAGGTAAGAAMDGAITGVESAINGEFTPSGQIAAWDAVVKNDSPDAVLDGLIGAIVTPVFDGLAGQLAGKLVQKRLVKKAYKTLEDFRAGEGLVSSEEAFKAQEIISKYAESKLTDVPTPVDELPDATYNNNPFPHEALTGGQDVVYRGDQIYLQDGAPDRLFNSGVPPRGRVDADAFMHQSGIVMESCYVSTSHKMSVARRFGASGTNPSDYAVLRARAINGLDLNVSSKLLRVGSRYAHEFEVSILDRIQPRNIEGLFVVRDGATTFHANPNYFVPTPERMSLPTGKGGVSGYLRNGCKGGAVFVMRKELYKTIMEHANKE
ncbi:hypothetical protein H9P43_009091 [Blastocladiella emersonii ATCC 22665]|nr:hypothetical protein H9P43_009091 [Blastocladiella emersonii ATCC 22665]